MRTITTDGLHQPQPPSSTRVTKQRGSGPTRSNCFESSDHFQQTQTSPECETTGQTEQPVRRVRIRMSYVSVSVSDARCCFLCSVPGNRRVSHPESGGWDYAAFSCPTIPYSLDWPPENRLVVICVTLSQTRPPATNQQPFLKNCLRIGFSTRNTASESGLPVKFRLGKPAVPTTGLRTGRAGRSTPSTPAAFFGT